MHSKQGCASGVSIAAYRACAAHAMTALGQHPQLLTTVKLRQVVMSALKCRRRMLVLGQDGMAKSSRVLQQALDSCLSIFSNGICVTQRNT